MPYQRGISSGKMGSIKFVYSLINGLFGAIWGLTVIDLFAILFSGQDSPVYWLDTGVKLIMAVAGAIYFIAKGIIELPHKNKMQKLDLERKKLEVEKMKKGDENSIAQSKE